MPFPEKLRSAWPLLTFAFRHLLIVPLTILVVCLLWTIAYILLLIAAVVMDGGIGGPLAYPAGIIMIVLTCVLTGWGIFTPSCAVGAIFCRVLGLPRLAAIPVVFTSGLGLSYLLCLIFVESLTSASMPSVWIVLKNFTLFLSIPLGFYWWLTEGVSALLDAFRVWILNRVRLRRSVTAPKI